MELWQGWTPQPGPQTQVCESEADEILVGGPAGIGKTALALILATEYHRRAIIFRREYPQLKEIIQKSSELLRGSGASYNSNDKVWRHIPGDRLIEFGAMQKDDDKYNYQGREFSLHVYDEITHFTEGQFRYTKNWNRTSLENEPCRVVATGNPPTEKQGLWVIAYWAPWIDDTYTKRTGRPKALPGELRWFVSVVESGKSIDKEVDSPDPIEVVEDNGKIRILTPRSRTFITGNLQDNAYLARTNYESTLQALPEPLRSQLLDGLWLSFAQDNPWQVIPTAWVEQAMKRWKQIPPHPQTHLGVDVARGGKDQTIIVCRHKNWIAPLVCFPGADTPRGDLVADQIMLQHAGKSEVRIDVVGVGGSPYDFLYKKTREMPRDRKFKVVGLSGGQATEATDRSGMLGFSNMRSQWWWNLRELLDPINGANIALPNDELLLEELTAPRWSKNSRDRISVEKKEELAKVDRLGRSPDRADAVAYAFADDTGKSETNYDALKSLFK